MEPELLREIALQLVVIKWLLVLVIASFVAIPIGTFAMMQRLGNKMAANSVCGTDFRSRASALADKGSNDEVIAMCQERMKSAPFDANAWWYAGVAYYNKHDYPQAVEHLEKAVDISPHLNREYVSPYLERIKRLTGE